LIYECQQMKFEKERKKIKRQKPERESPKVDELSVSFFSRNIATVILQQLLFSHKVHT